MDANEMLYCSNTIESMLYECKKHIFLPDYTPSTCQWEGVLEDYVYHVRNEHPKNYFVLTTKPTELQWKLPYIGNQTDYGILEYSSNCFLYEINYEKTSSHIYFSITHLQKLAGCLRYKFKLHLNGIKAQSLSCEINMVTAELLKPIKERNNKIVINALEVVDDNRVFKWSLMITDICNAE